MEQQDTVNNRTFVLLNFRSIINCGGDHVYVLSSTTVPVALLVPEIHCVTDVSSRKRFFLRETLNPHILVSKDLLQKAFGQRPFRWRLTVCLLCMAHLERMICCLSGMFLEYMEPPQMTSNQKNARQKRPDMSTKYVNIKPKKTYACNRTTGCFGATCLSQSATSSIQVFYGFL